MNDLERFPLNQNAGLSARAVPDPTDNIPVSADAGTQDARKNNLAGMLVILERLVRQVRADAELSANFDILISHVRRRING